MEKLDYDKYSTEQLREMLRRLVESLTDAQCGDVLEELKTS